MAIRTIVLLMIASSPAIAPPDLFVSKLDDLSGPDAVDCSLKGEEPTDLARSLECVKSASANSKPFKAIIGVNCPDCSFWIGAAGTSTGEFWHVVYDSNPNGSASDKPRLSIDRCSKLHLDEDGFPFIVCIP